MSVESLPSLPRPRPWVMRIFLLVLVLMAAAPPLAVFYTDWLWYREVGFQQVFLTSLLARAGIVVATGLAVALFLVANFGVALRGLRIPLLMVKGPGQEPTPFVIEEKQLKLVAFGIAVLVGGFIGLGAATHWQSLLMYWHAEPFGSVDPILGKEVSYYVLKLPLLLAGQRLALGVLALAVAGSAGIYALGGGVQLATDRLMATRAARRHLASLVAGLLLVLAAGALLERARLLTTETALIYGAGYADVHARLPALGALFAVSLVAAGLALTSAFTPRLRPLATGVVLYAVVALAGSGYAALLQRFVVAPNEQTREAPFIEHNIAATRQAFDLHEIEERQLSGDAELSAADIEANQATLSNVRLWDHRPLLDTFGQIQEIRTYYDFVSVDNDRYTIDGEYRQIMLSARELNSSSLPNRTWMNERLIFTHGYGVTLGPVNEVTAEGLPVLFIKDLPPVSTRDLEVDQPSIYYGELSSDYVLANTGTEEFHYPQGDDNVFTNYDGRGGGRDRQPGTQAPLQRSLRLFEDPLLGGPAGRKSRPLSPPPCRSSEEDRPLPASGRRPLSRHRGRAPVLDPGRLHDQPPVSVLDAGGRWDQLHPQLRQGRHRRLSRNRHVLSRTARRPDREDAREDLPQPAPAARRHA